MDTTRKSYPSDVSDTEWDFLLPYLTLMREDAPQRANKLRQVYDALRYVAFIAEVPELPGCAADGGTYQETLVNVEVVIREWIETAQELGRPVPVPQGRFLSAAV